MEHRFEVLYLYWGSDAYCGSYPSLEEAKREVERLRSGGYNGPVEIHETKLIKEEGWDGGHVYRLAWKDPH